jgi:hypothetical protein
MLTDRAAEAAEAARAQAGIHYTCYWYKSTNTDSSERAQAEAALILLALLVQKYKY